jgi:hypothetical protein
MSETRQARLQPRADSIFGDCGSLLIPLAGVLIRSTRSGTRAPIAPALPHWLTLDPRSGSAGIAQPRGYAVDREVYALAHPLVGVAVAVAPQKLNLKVVQRLDVGQAQAD